MQAPVLTGAFGNNVDVETLVLQEKDGGFSLEYHSPRQSNTLWKVKKFAWEIQNFC